MNIFLGTYNLPLHPPKRLEGFATIFMKIFYGFVAEGHVDISKCPPQKHPF